MQSLHAFLLLLAFVPACGISIRYPHSKENLHAVSSRASVGVYARQYLGKEFEPFIWYVKREPLLRVVLESDLGQGRVPTIRGGCGKPGSESRSFIEQVWERLKAMVMPKKKLAGTKRTWDWREASDNVKKARVHEEEMTKEHDASHHKSGLRPMIEAVRAGGPLEGFEMEHTRLAFVSGVCDQAGLGDMTENWLGEPEERRLTSDHIELDTYLDLDVFTNVSAISRYLPIMALQVPLGMYARILRELRELLLTPPRPELSVLRPVDSNCGLPQRGDVLIFFNQTLVRTEAVDELPVSEASKQLLQACRAKLLPFCISRTYHWSGAFLRQQGRGMWVRPINRTLLYDVPISVLFEIGVPTHPYHVHPWRRAAGLADGTFKQDWVDMPAHGWSNPSPEEWFSLSWSAPTWECIHQEDGSICGQVAAAPETLHKQMRRRRKRNLKPQEQEPDQKVAAGTRLEKRVLSCGYGGQPDVADDALVHFVAWVGEPPPDLEQGLLLASTRNGVPLRLSLAKSLGDKRDKNTFEGHVQWEEGGADLDEAHKRRFTDALCVCARSMRVGEVCELRMQTSEIKWSVQMELIVLNMEVLTEDGGVVGSISHAKASDSETPRKDDEVYVSYSGSYGGQLFVQKDEEDCEKGVLGEGSLTAGMEEALLMMREGSTANLSLSSDYAFGDVGLPHGVPPYGRVEFNVTLLGWNSVYNVSSGVKVKLSGRLRKQTVMKCAPPGDGERPEALYETHGKRQIAYEPHQFVEHPGVFHDIDGKSLGKAVLHARQKRMVIKGRSRKASSVTASKRDRKSSDHGVASPNDVEEVGCQDGVRVRLMVHAYCHDVGIFGRPLAPGIKLSSWIRDLQQLPEWQNAYGIKVPLCQKAMHQQLGEALGFFHREEEVCVVLGDGDLPRGLEMGLTGLRKGNCCKITVDAENAKIPDPPGGWCAKPMENPFPVSYLVQIKEVTPLSALTPLIRLASAKRRKGVGSAAFVQGRYSEADQYYKSALDVLNLGPAGEELAEHDEIETSCLLNRAACLHKLGRYGEARDICNQVLSMKPECSKARFRRSQALAAEGDTAGARKDLEYLKERGMSRAVGQALKKLDSHDN